jgi:hypothetical protein
MFGMRPVGAPDHAVGKALDDGARERHHVVVGRAGTVKRSGQVTLVIQVLLASSALSQFWKCLPFDALFHVGQAM